MSSHHIVREKQEPALLVLGLENFPDELLGQLLEWSPTVITTPLTAEQISSQGIKVDMIIADEANVALQSDVRLIANLDGIVESALNFLIASDYKAVNIITDNVDISQFQFYADKINLVIFHNNQKIYPVISGFSKWKAAGEIITFLSPAEDVQTNGLQQLDINTYQTVNDGLFVLKFNSPFLFISEDL